MLAFQIHKMTESERIADWCRFYKAAVPSYRAEALRSVWVNERPIFNKVVDTLKLDLAKLMQEITD